MSMMNARSSRGAIWVSAVLFMAVSVVIISLLLSAALPLIESMKQRNILAETKHLLTVVDESIRTVAREGPGSQRDVHLTIDAGKLIINQDDDTLLWEMVVSDKLIEPGYVITEGQLRLYLATTPVKNKYKMNITLSYADTVDLLLDTQYQNPFFGKYTAIIAHNSSYATSSTGTSMPQVKVKIL